MLPMKTQTLLPVAALALALTGSGLQTLSAQSTTVAKATPKVSVEEFRTRLKKDGAPLPNSGQVLMSYATVAEKIMPSVVRVTSSVPVENNPRMGGGGQIPPQWREFFRRFGLPEDGGPFGGDGEEEGGGGPRGRQDEQKGTGSGVIISPDGYILTNNHVVENADKIEVTVGNESKSYKAKIIGADPLTDVAVIKIEGTNLPAAVIGDSSKLRVGDVVLAAGNPMELSQTLTQGIVSAIGRTGMGIVHQGRNLGFENFIQTDASINPGNSGGPLVDALGRVVGINTAIMTRTGMNAGIGFSIPINMALRVGEDLLDDGKVSRGFLGVTMKDIDPEDAKAMGLGDRGGVLINSVVEDSPANKAGITEGDLVVGVAGQKVDNSLALRSLVGSALPGVPVDIELLRDGKSMKVQAVLGGVSDEELAKRASERGNSPFEGKSKTAPAKFISGATAQDITPGLRERYDIPDTIKTGVVIVAVEPNTPAAGAGLEEGDVVISINNKVVENLNQAKTLAKGGNDPLGLRIVRKGQKQFIVVNEDAKSE